MIRRSGIPFRHRAPCTPWNAVRRCSTISTDADELTYNLHIMLRFDLELQLLEGKLRVKDLAEAWRAAMQTDLDVAPADEDRYGGVAGTSLGTEVSSAANSRATRWAMVYCAHAAALKANPDIQCEISSGEFGTLHTWLRDSVYQHGSKFAPNHLIERAAGAAMNMTPYFDYLRGV